jgi:hypothetical protein
MLPTQEPPTELFDNNGTNSGEEQQAHFENINDESDYSLPYQQHHPGIHELYGQKQMAY